MAASALLFDLDGTVWDSYRWYASLITCKAGISQSTIISRLQNGESIVTLKNEFKVSDSEFIDRCSEVKLYPGVIQTLGELSKRKTPMAVVTSLPGRFVEPMLEELGLRDYFLETIHAGNCRNLKPHPQPILMALSSIVVSPSKDVFYVGDLATDALAASNAGISFAWASYGYGTSTPSPTNVVLNEFKDILAL